MNAAALILRIPIPIESIARAARAGASKDRAEHAVPLSLKITTRVLVFLPEIVTSKSREAAV
jgi:hypothetical protein